MGPGLTNGSGECGEHSLGGADLWRRLFGPLKTLLFFRYIFKTFILNFHGSGPCHLSGGLFRLETELAPRRKEQLRL